MNKKSGLIFSNLVYLLNFLVLIGYFIWYKSGTKLPTYFVFWVWLPYLLFLFLNHYEDGHQNTTRNLARIYLLKKYGINYNNELVKMIQIELIPDSLFLETMIWQISHVTSFVLILFYQGWITALIAELIIPFFCSFLPLFYQSHLRLILKYFRLTDIEKHMRLSLIGVNFLELFVIIEKAVQEKRNPQLWWGEVLKETYITESEANLHSND